MAYSLITFALALFVYSISDSFSNHYMLTFVLLSVCRYLRLIVNIVAFSQLRGHPIKKNPTFNSTDVSVVVPTVFADKDEVMACLKRIRVCNPLQMIVVTKDELVPQVYAACAEITAAVESDDEKLDMVQVIGVAKLNKRTQMVAALQQAVTGSIFTSFTNFLGICYLERRNFNTGATNLIDGAVSTLSGRTSFYRATLIQNENFYSYFMNALNHDDDKNLTRWVYDQGLQITLQFAPAARIMTTLETDFTMFIGQCMRWARGHWRGNFRVMATTTYWYDTHIWSLYAIYLGQFQTPAIAIDGFLCYFLYHGLSEYDTYTRIFALISLCCWIFFTKIVKLIPHFCEFPQDIVYIPGMVLFSYGHGFLNVFALFTRDNKVWGR
ncbi:unnamed protein product [Aureobasidium uvarum]|uniref:Glycosyltransferase family 2 protein n=1 Tax=Aureobasidium uvarum TaxID=2773716 RepID=A0A9N8PQS6_9PEZI|nr:unnamed protein product [Aureobasidium uvarum]